MTENATKTGPKKSRLPLMLGGVVLGMFAFGWTSQLTLLAHANGVIRNRKLY